MVRKECFDRIGFFDENLPAGQDYDMWIRLAKHYQFDYVREPLVLYRVHDKRITTDPHRKLRATKLLHTKYSKELITSLKHRKILGSWQFSLGVRYCKCGDLMRGKKELVKAIANDPFSILYYATLFASFFGSTVFNLLIDLSNSFLPTSFKIRII